MHFRLLPLRLTAAAAFSAWVLLGSSRAQADEEIPAPRPLPPPVAVPPPNTSPPQVAAREDGSSGERGDNAVYVEAGGPTLLYSINYDRRLGDHFALRIGGSYLNLRPSNSFMLRGVGLPATAQLLLGRGDAASHFELGGGVMPLFGQFRIGSNSISDVGVCGVVTAAYRLQRYEGGFFLRTGLTMVVGQLGGIVLPGIALGGSF